MKREILFRAKTSAGSAWIYGGGVITLPNGKCVMLHLDDEQRVAVTIVVAETVGQFVGLTDKNQVKIFEDDIVQYVNPQHENEDYHMRYVVWDEKHAAFRIWKIPRNRLDIRHYHIKFDKTDTKRLVVVGNRIDNPDLMGEA